MNTPKLWSAGGYAARREMNPPLCRLWARCSKPASDIFAVLDQRPARRLALEGRAQQLLRHAGKEGRRRARKPAAPSFATQSSIACVARCSAASSSRRFAVVSREVMNAQVSDPSHG